MEKVTDMGADILKKEKEKVRKNKYYRKDMHLIELTMLTYLKIRKKYGLCSHWQENRKFRF